MKQINAVIEPAKAKAGALSILRSGGLVAVPTETVYGLAADATNGLAIARVFAAKGRPHFNPLICHVSSLAMAERYGEFSALARQLAGQFWPGPLTLVVPLKPGSGIHDLVSAGLDTIALRCPQGIVREIAHDLDRPLAAPSANTSGRISATTAQHVSEDLGDKVDLIIDGGACAIGLESTIIKISGSDSILLRSGAVTVEAIEKTLQKPIIRPQTSTSIEAPGMMQSHYAPRAALRLNATSAGENEVLLAFGKSTQSPPNHSLNLSEAGDLAEAAANLYNYLKLLDATGVATIAVQPVPLEGLGEAINDRLNRAAAPRSIVHE